MTRIIAKSIAVALMVSALDVGAVGTSSMAIAQGRGQAAPSNGLPDALRRAAIATRSDRNGQIAGAQIGTTGVYVVYVKTANGCGSGGCRAQIWKREVGQFVRKEAIPVGRLPIVVLPQTAHGMPILGITVFDKDRGGVVVLPIGFDGKAYRPLTDCLPLPANSGNPLLTQGMLRVF